MKLRTAFDYSFLHGRVLAIVDEKNVMKSVNESEIAINLMNTKLNCVFRARLDYQDVPEGLEVFDSGVDRRFDNGKKSIALVRKPKIGFYEHNLDTRIKHYNFLTVKDEKGEGDFFLNVNFEVCPATRSPIVKVGLYFTPKILKSTRCKVFEVVLSNVLNTNISESLQYYFHNSNNAFNFRDYTDYEVAEYNLAWFNEEAGLYNSIQHIAAKFAYDLNSLLVTTDSKKKDRARIIVDKYGELQIHGENLQGSFMNEFLTLFNKFSTRLGKALCDLGYKLSVEVKNSDHFSFFL